MKTENLDAVATEYRPDAATAIENDLILNWYPERIIRRFGSVGSILELGIGHGFTPGLFNAACERHVIIEGSQFVHRSVQDEKPGLQG